MPSQRLSILPVRLGHAATAIAAAIAVALFGITVTPTAATALPTAPTVTVLPGSTWPVSGRPAVRAGFDPPVGRYGTGHRGVDLAGTVGTPVLSVAAGTVTVARRVAGVPVVVVDHGALRSTYQPVAATVTVGTRVGPGDPVGRLLSGGHCRPEVCLHWGVLRGEDYLDPLTVVRPSAPAELTLLPAAAVRLVAQRQQARVAAFPVGGPSGRFGLTRPVGGPVSSPYGNRLHPLLHIEKLHDGTDFAAPCGTPIGAPHAGVVTRRSSDGAYGNRLFVDHGLIAGRHVVTALNHAADYSVRVGESVHRGEVLGHVGATGYATGCHLHLMVWLDGGLVDPESVL